MPYTRGPAPGTLTYDILHAIVQRPGCRIASLNDEFGQVNGMVHVLVRRGLVERRRAERRGQLYATRAAELYCEGNHQSLPRPTPGGPTLRAGTRAAAVLDAVVSEPGALYAADIAADLDCTIAAIHRAIYRLRALGLLTPQLPLCPTGAGVWAAHHHRR